jgi:hypothetical protein
MSFRRAGLAATPDPAAGRSSRGSAPVGPSLPASPPATRIRRPRWRDPRLVVGLAVIAVCALLGARSLAAAHDTVSVWAVRGPLDAGRRLDEGDLVRREVGFVDQVDADRYLSARSALPAGSVLARPVGAGELLPRSALAAGTAGPVTEVPLSVDAEAVPATVHEGSTVDVWVTTRTAASGERTPAARPSTLVFDEVQVLAVPVSGTSLGPTATRQVSIAVPADQRARLSRSLAVLAAGDVVLTVRR